MAGTASESEISSPESSKLMGKASKGAAESKMPKEKPSHPSTSKMVTDAIKSLNERGGSSLQAIKKYIAANYVVNPEKISPFIKKYLKGAVSSGKLTQTAGKGATGSFKIPGMSKSKSAQKKSAEPEEAETVSGKKKVKSNPGGKKAKPASDDNKVKSASVEKKTKATSAKPASDDNKVKSASVEKKTKATSNEKKLAPAAGRKTKLANKATAPAEKKPTTKVSNKKAASVPAESGSAEAGPSGIKSKKVASQKKAAAPKKK